MHRPHTRHDGHRGGLHPKPKWSEPDGSRPASTSAATSSSVKSPSGPTTRSPPDGPSASLRAPTDTEAANTSRKGGARAAAKYVTGASPDARHEGFERYGRRHVERVRAETLFTRRRRDARPPRLASGFDVVVVGGGLLVAASRGRTLTLPPAVLFFVALVTLGATDGR